MIENFTRRSDHDTFRSIALTGGPGAGKFFSIEPNINSMLKSLAKSLPVNTRSDDPLKDIIFYLRFNTAPILIVFDNFTMPDSASERKPLEDAFGKLRQFPHVHMLLTTRDFPLPENVRWLHLQIPPLSREAAIQTF